MENNSLVLGRIPVSGDGIHKTYEESFIRYITANNLKTVFGPNSYGLFFNTKNNVVEYASSEEQFDILNKTSLFKRVEVINIAKLADEMFFIELIEPSILHQHLLDERMILEDMRSG